MENKKASFQDKLLYATTIALIVSNIATLALALIFAKALGKNIDDSLRLNVAGSRESDLRKRTIEGSGFGIPYSSDTCDSQYEDCVATCAETYPKGSSDATACNSLCEWEWHQCRGS